MERTGWWFRSGRNVRTTTPSAPLRCFALSCWRSHPWPGLLLNRQFLLARLRRAFLQDSPTPGGSLRFAHRGLTSFTPPACKPAAREGCEDISPGLSEAIPGVIATPLFRRTLKACEEIPVEQQARHRRGDGARSAQVCYCRLTPRSVDPLGKSVSFLNGCAFCVQIYRFGNARKKRNAPPCDAARRGG